LGDLYNLSYSTVRTELPSAERAYLLYKVPLYNVRLAVRVPETISRAHLVPDGEALSLDRAAAAVAVTVPVVHRHKAVVFEY